MKRNLARKSADQKETSSHVAPDRIATKNQEEIKNRNEEKSWEKVGRAEGDEEINPPQTLVQTELPKIAKLGSDQVAPQNTNFPQKWQNLFSSQFFNRCDSIGSQKFVSS